VARIQFNQQRIERRSVLGMWLLVAFTSALLSVACLSPTLPLPPPSRPDVSAPDEDGNIRISGVVQSRAGVFAHNQRTDQVVGEMTGADGVYDLIMQAQVGDRIAVWQSVNTKESASTEVVVPAVTIDNDTPADPDAMGGTTGE
jgi:hypothetical protein